MTAKVDINVNVSSLLAKALQQTLANREGLVIREGRAKAEERGVKERRAQRIREGRNPETGDPLPSRGGQGRFGSDVQRIDEEPAANRRGGGVLLEPAQGYVNYGGTLTGLRSISRGRYKPSVFARFSVEDETVYPFGRNFPEMEFLSGGGPTASSNALRLAIAIPFTPATPIPYTQFIGGTALDYPYFNSFNVEENSQEIVYAAAGSYDTVLNWQSLLSSAQAPVPQTLSLGGEIQDALPKVKVSDLRGSTHEIFVKFSNLTEDSPTWFWRIQQAALGIDRLIAGVQILTDGITIGIEASKVTADGGPANSAGGSSTIIRTEDNLSGFSVVARRLAPDQNFTVFFRGATIDRSYRGSTIDGDIFFDPKIPKQALDSEEWVHMAVTRTAIPETNDFVYAVYVNGSSVLRTVITTTEAWRATYGQHPVSARIRCFSRMTAQIPLPPIIPQIHGYRFTPRVLYRGDSFIPPSAITRLA